MSVLKKCSITVKMTNSTIPSLITFSMKPMTFKNMQFNMTIASRTHDGNNGQTGDRVRSLVVVAVNNDHDNVRKKIQTVSGSMLQNSSDNRANVRN